MISPHNSNALLPSYIIIIVKADDIEMGNIVVRKRKILKLKYEYSFMGKIHEAYNNDDRTIRTLMKISWFYTSSIQPMDERYHSHDQLQK